MKKRTLLVFSFVILLLIAPACGNKEEEMPAATEEQDPAQIEAAKDSEPEEELSQQNDSGPCNNILFPLNDGNNWVYEVESSDGSGEPIFSEYAWSVSGQTEDSVKLGTLFYDSGTVLSADVQCLDGAVENFPLTTSNIVVGDMEGAIDYEYVSGKYLPSFKELEDGNWENTWQTVVNSSGTITADFEGQTTGIVLDDSPLTMNWQILEKDVSVTVPAGTFDNAVRINQELIYEINSLTIEGGDMPMEISTTMIFDSDYWFVPNLGLVKTEINSTNVQLFGSSFPVDMTGVSMLKSSNLLD